MKTHKIAVIRGDGIGSEIIEQALRVLKAAASKFGFECAFEEFLLGGAAIDACGVPLPEATIKGCKAADAVLFGAIGGPKWDNLERSLRPESGLLGIRAELEVFANLRPAKVYDELIEASPLKPQIVQGADILVVRELIGGIYFGSPKGREMRDGVEFGYNTMVYSEPEIRRIAKVAFESAQKRKKRVCSIDKANVLDVSALWREVVADVAKNYPSVSLENMYVDNAAMQLVRDPRQFDVILTGNLFGDILSDEASQIIGSIGLLPSASIGEKYALYEPIHGSAPDIAGQGIANPIATISSAALALRYSLGEEDAANAIESAIAKALAQGYRTKDLANFGASEVCNCERMGEIIASLV